MILRFLAVALTFVLLQTSWLSARSFFELLNQGFQQGGRAGLDVDPRFQFHGPLMKFQEPDYLGPKSGLVDHEDRGASLWGTVTGGYDTNAAGIMDGMESWFSGVLLGASENFTVGSQNVFVGARARWVRFDRDVFSTFRAGVERAIFDIDVRAGFFREFSPSVTMTGFHQLNVGGFRQFGQPYVLPGVGEQDQVLYRNASQLVYRFDRQPVDQAGWQFTSALRGTLMLGVDLHDRDFWRKEARQSVDHIVSDTLAYGMEGRFGVTDWENMGTVDSTSYAVLLTTSGRVGPRTTYQVSAGWEWWVYGDPAVNDRNNLRTEMTFETVLSEQFSLAGGLTYGVDTVLPMGDFATADPMALKVATSAVWSNGLYTVATILSYSAQESDLVRGRNESWNRWGVGISLDREIGSDARVGVSIEYSGVDTPQAEFDDLQTALRIRKDF